MTCRSSDAQRHFFDVYRTRVGVTSRSPFVVGRNVRDSTVTSGLSSGRSAARKRSDSKSGRMPKPYRAEKRTRTGVTSCPIADRPPVGAFIDAAASSRRDLTCRHGGISRRVGNELSAPSCVSRCGRPRGRGRRGRDVQPREDQVQLRELGIGGCRLTGRDPVGSRGGRYRRTCRSDREEPCGRRTRGASGPPCIDRCGSAGIRHCRCRRSAVDGGRLATSHTCGSRLRLPGRGMRRSCFPTTKSRRTRR